MLVVELRTARLGAAPALWVREARERDTLIFGFNNGADEARSELENEIENGKSVGDPSQRDHVRQVGYIAAAPRRVAGAADRWNSGTGH